MSSNIQNYVGYLDLDLDLNYLKCSFFQKSLKESTKMSRLFLFKIFFLCVFLLCDLVPLIYGKGQFVQPLNMGMQMAIPYDIANTFNRPISATTSTILSLSLAAILFFGVVTSPFGYMFGIPSRKYVLGSEADLLASQYTALSQRRQDSSIKSWKISPRSLDLDLGIDTGHDSQNQNHDDLNSNFVQSLFYYMDNEPDEECRKMVLCQSHGILNRMPKSFLHIYKFFSRHLTQVPSEYRKAILTGIGEMTTDTTGKSGSGPGPISDKCHKAYPGCKKSSFGMVISTLIGLLPTRSRKNSRYL